MKKPTALEQHVIMKLKQKLPIAIITMRTGLPRDFVLKVYRKWFANYRETAEGIK